MALFLLVAGVLMSLRWPAEWQWGQVPVLLLLLLECWHNERRLMQRTGRLVLDDQGNWLWRGEHWRLARKADWLACGVLLELRNPQGKRWRLWLMHDNLPPNEWRTLRACCLLREGAAA